MKKLTRLLIILLVVICSTLPNAFAESKTFIANPWVDCQDNFALAKEVSGITFPLRLSNYWIRAMKGMIEVSYPLDEFREVLVRKTEKDLGWDISGVYTKYPKNKELNLKNGNTINIRAKRTKIYVMTFSSNKGYYSAYCEQGMSKREALGVYEVVMDAEKQNK